MANELRVNLIGDASKLTKSLNTASAKLSNFGKRVSSIGASLSTRLTLPLGIAGGAAIKLASDFEESLNKVNVAFGKSSSEVRQFAKTTLTQFGIAEGSALDMAALFGDMATSMGISRSEAADMSTSMVGLAGDLASFKNIGIDQATTALAGVFTGETESLKRLGIVMTEVNLKSFALSQGIEKNIKDMTQSEKVNLRYQFILAQTANSQGDFARTQTGAANQMRIFTEGSKQLGQNLGSLLLPAFTKVVTKLNSLVTSFINLDTETKSLILSIGAIVGGIGPALFIFGKLATAIGLLMSPIGLVVAGLGTIVFIIHKNFNEILPVVVKLINRFVDLFNTSESLRFVVAGIKTAFKIAFIAIKAQVDQVINGLGIVGDLIIEFADKGLSGNFGQVISDGLAEGADIAKKSGEDIQQALIDGVNDGLNSRLEHVTVEGVKSGLSKIGDKFKNSLNFFGGASGQSTNDDDSLQSRGVATTAMDPATAMAVGTEQGLSKLQDGLKKKRDLLKADLEQSKNMMTGFQGLMTLVGDDMKNSLSQIGPALSQSLGVGESAFGTFAVTLISGAMTSLSSSLASTLGFATQGASQTALSFGPLAAIVLPALLAGAAVAVKGAFSKIKAPAKFASGGIVSAPTMGLVGEYPGSRSNPEVIAPLDRLKGMLGDRGVQQVNVGGSFTLKGQDLIVALERANSNRNRIL